MVNQMYAFIGSRVLSFLIGQNVGCYDPSELGNLSFVLVKKNKWSFVNCWSSLAGKRTSTRGNSECPKPHSLVLLQRHLFSPPTPRTPGGHKP